MYICCQAVVPFRNRIRIVLEARYSKFTSQYVTVSLKIVLIKHGIVTTYLSQWFIAGK